MSLPTSASLYSYLRLETTTEVALLDTLVSASTQACFNAIGRDVTAVTSSDYFSPRDIGRVYPRSTRLVLQNYPIKSGSVTITDFNGDVFDAATYRVDNINGICETLLNYRFGPYPLTVDYIQGLEFHPLYAVKYEPILSRAIVDLAATWFQNRTPDASSHAASEISYAYFNTPLPPRILGLLSSIKKASFVRSWSTS